MNNESKLHIANVHPSLISISPTFISVLTASSTYSYLIPKHHPSLVAIYNRTDLPVNRNCTLIHNRVCQFHHQMNTNLAGNSLEIFDISVYLLLLVLSCGWCVVSHLCLHHAAVKYKSPLLSSDVICNANQ